MIKTQVSTPYIHDAPLFVYTSDKRQHHVSIARMDLWKLTMFLLWGRVVNQDFSKKQSVYIVFLTSETICIFPWAHLKTNILDTWDVFCIWYNSLYVYEPDMFRLMRLLVMALISTLVWVFIKVTLF